jgi:hypothetical protein
MHLIFWPSLAGPQPQNAKSPLAPFIKGGSGGDFYACGFVQSALPNLTLSIVESMPTNLRAYLSLVFRSILPLLRLRVYRSSFHPVSIFVIFSASSLGAIAIKLFAKPHQSDIMVKSRLQEQPWEFPYISMNN